MATPVAILSLLLVAAVSLLIVRAGTRQRTLAVEDRLGVASARFVPEGDVRIRWRKSKRL